MDIDRTIYLAKAGRLARGDVYAALLKGAEERRAPGESTAQSFAKFIAGEGSELMRLHSALGAAGSGGIVHDTPTPSSSLASITKSAGAGAWHDLVAFHKQAHKRAHPHDSDAKANAAATAAALSTPEGAHLFKLQKRSEQITSGMFAPVDLQTLEVADTEQQQHVDLHKRANQYMSEFDHMVADVKREKPHLSESEAGDHVRSTADGMAAWIKHKGKPGQNGVPAPEGDTATTGRAPPMWQSDHSGSAPVTPDRTPSPLDDTPTVKAWEQLVRSTQFGLRDGSRQRAVEICKLLSPGRKLFERIVEEAMQAGPRVNEMRGTNSG